MAPTTEALFNVLAGRSNDEHGYAPVLSRRDLTVNDTQKVTLGVIAAYVVGIAILWNVPYIRWVLWPFKVSYLPTPALPFPLVPFPRWHLQRPHSQLPTHTYFVELRVVSNL